jgi:rod shape-determining protein MreC
VARITELRDDPGSPFATVIAEPTARLDRSHEVLLVWTLAAPRTAAAATDADPGAADHAAARSGRVAEAAGGRR